MEREAEKAQYDFHQNAPDDLRYREFLDRLCKPLATKLQPASQGLDFGCGSGPTLSVMFEERGHRVSLFDSFYFPNFSVFEACYDFITATEVVEHLHRPGLEFSRLWSCLRPGGHFGIMTKRVIDKAAFSRWHYKNDPTHVCFFSESTFRWLASQWQAELEFPAADVAIFTKAEPSTKCGTSDALATGQA